MLSLVFFVCALVIISSVLAVAIFAYLFFLLGSAFSTVTSSETSLSIAVQFQLYSYSQHGVYPLKLGTCFHFLGHMRRLVNRKTQNKQKQTNKPRERSGSCSAILQAGRECDIVTPSFYTLIKNASSTNQIAR